jgi:4'-phosphopantetheinyl transferase
VPKTMIQILYSSLNKRLSAESWRTSVHALPDVVRLRINRYRRWEDQQARLFGMLLVLEGLKGLGCYCAGLNDLSTDKFGRPFINGQIDFNISHSCEYVVCAFTDSGRVGIDLERIRPLDLSEMDRYLTAKELEDIRRASDASRELYRLWTRKESILKADGRGLAVNLREIRLEGWQAILQGRTWFLREIKIDPHYSCHVAANQQVLECRANEVVFEQSEMRQ